LTEVLQEEFGGSIYEDWDDSVWTKGGADVDGRHVCQVPEECRDYFVFAVVRNPYALELSRYNYWPDSKEWYWRGGVPWPKRTTFSEYLRDYAPTFGLTYWTLYKQCNDPWIGRGCVPFDLGAVIKLESLDEDFNALPFVKTPIRIPVRNASKNPLPSRYVKMEDVDRVYEMRKDDFLNFGYDKKIPLNLFSCMI
jgi:hypothetical protein